MKKSMTPDEFIAYAQEQTEKASGESRSKALKRIEALEEATAVAKESFTTSARANIPVFTEPTPTVEVDPQAAAKASDGKGNFASNLDELNKRLAKLKGDEEKEDDEEGKGKKTKTEKRLHGLDVDGFPDDMNDPDFLEKGHLEGPGWGYDDETPS